MIHTDNKDILLEATDPSGGFVQDSLAIQQRVLRYKQNQFLMADKNKVYYRFHFNLYNTVNMDQLTGLMYYNQAVKAYNERNIMQSACLLDLATAKYTSPRTDELSAIISMTLRAQNDTPSPEQARMKGVLSKP